MKELYLEVFSNVLENGICFVPVETVVVLFLYKYCKEPPILITLVLAPLEESRPQFKIKLPKLLFEILDEDDIDMPGNLCKLPLIVTNDGNSCSAGLCSVLRQLVKTVDEKHPLLGFKQGCLCSCAESSIWTKFCEVETIEMVNDFFINISNIKEIPSGLARFETHMGKPVKVHNIQKERQDLAKDEGVPVHSGTPDSRLEMIKDLEHVYSEGHKMSLVDLILLPSFHLIFQATGNMFLRQLPLTRKWYDNLLSDNSIKTCIKFVLNSGILVDEFEYFVPEVNDVGLYKSEGRDSRGKKRSYTKQDVIDGCLERVKDVMADVTVSNRTFGYDVSFDWPMSPFGKEFPEKRISRKLQQLENMVKAVLKIAKNGDCIVDFCSGSGYLGILIAHLLPSCRVILLENKEESLIRARQQANYNKLTNVFFCQGNIDYFRGNFDIGMTLHACGVATDLVIEKCLSSRASFVCCPCCYGSIRSNHIISYPRSDRFKNASLNTEDYLTLAHSADQTHDESNTKTSQGKKCMTIVDADRCLRAKENGYVTYLSVMEPSSCSPKNHILVGVPHSED